MLLKCVGFCLMLLVCAVDNAQTQASECPSEPVTIIQDILPRSLRWSSQDLQLALLDGSSVSGTVQLETDELDTFGAKSWYLFDVESMELSSSNTWALQPDIPEAIANLVEPDTLMFLSPSGTHLVFASRAVEAAMTGLVSYIHILDIPLRTILETDIPSGQMDNLVGFNDVIWGTDERFVLFVTPQLGASITPEPVYVNVSGGIVTYRQIAVIYLGERDFFVSGVFDISTDGMHVLMAGGFVGEGNAFFAIWDARVPDELHFLPETQFTLSNITSTLDAEFTTADGSSFVLFNEEGLVAYDLLTETKRVLTQDVIATDFREARFSAHGEALALADDTGVYWLDLRECALD